MQTSNALDPQSRQARVIYDLGIVSTIVFVLILVAVAGAIVYPPSTGGSIGNGTQLEISAA
jgi:hypothetical protein